MLKNCPNFARHMGGWHESRLRVRYEETDRMGVVYYGKFLTWLEVGRVNLLRDVGFGPKEWIVHELNWPVVQAHADYRASASFDDEILVKTRVASIGTKSIRFENEIYRLPEMKLLATGHTVHALMKGGHTIPFPAELKEKLTSS
jgi:acyl-CoA thioester hydrolase